MPFWLVVVYFSGCMSFFFCSVLDLRVVGAWFGLLVCLRVVVFVRACLYSLCLGIIYLWGFCFKGFLFSAVGVFDDWYFSCFLGFRFW